ncbi:MAG: DASS family sodium-coupled anion symporter [Gemmatimonadetes bacterium]|nr:DASS family sodium-coupled anion symporter [Gemmatimonadota bacterium]
MTIASETPPAPAGAEKENSGSGSGDRRRQIGLLLGPVAFAVILLLPAPSGMPAEAWRTAAVGVLMAVWWISEAIPIPATALLPLALLPLLRISPIDGAASPYANPVIFLFLGGFLIAQAMQRWNLHRRIALRVIRAVGTRPVPLIGGFMLAAAFLSMWVSNTATAVMMLPIGLSVIDLALRGDNGEAGTQPREPTDSNFAIALMLGIAYACSIGGLATLIGTPPNALLAGFMAETYGVQIGFAQWMLVGMPLAMIGLPIVWLVLTRWIYPVRLKEIPGGRAAIDREISAMGSLSRGETLVGIVFVLTALAWVTRPILERWIPELSDAGIAITAAIVLFALPVRLRAGEFVLNWEWAKRLPWDVLILFGGGLSLASAISRSGLAGWIGSSLAGFQALPVIAIVLVVTLVIIFLTELTSNTATAAAFLPVLASLAIGIGENPLLLAVPAALAASCAFMMPVATPPNAIVYGSSFVTIPQMARAGLILNILFLLLISLLGYLLVIFIFGVQVGVVPGWAR